MFFLSFVLQEVFLANSIFRPSLRIKVSSFNIPVFLTLSSGVEITSIQKKANNIKKKLTETRDDALIPYTLIHIIKTLQIFKQDSSMKKAGVFLKQIFHVSSKGTARK